MKYIQEYTFDINKDINERIRVKQNDTARILRLNLKKDGYYFNLSGYTLKMSARKPDLTYVFNNVDIINASKGICEITLTDQTLAVPGQLLMEVNIIQNEYIVSTMTFNIIVEKSLRNDTAIESSNEFNAVSQQLSQVEEWNKYFEETNGKIEEKYAERLNYIDNKIVRKFKPKFGIAQWWIKKDSTSNKWISKTNEEIEADIKMFSEIGVEEMSINIFCSYDKTEKEWYMIHSGAVALNSYNYCINYGIRPSTLKFMVYDMTKTEISETYIGSFKTFMTTKVRSFCSYLKSKGCEFDAVTVLNELPQLYTNTNHATFVSELLDIPKEFNYKASLSLTSVLEYEKIQNEIIDKIDIFCFNCYPTISYNGSETTIEESTRAWDRWVLIYKSIKQKHPDKEIIITEIGCQDRWESLVNPGDSTINTKYTTPTNGLAAEIFLRGLFESEMKNLVKSITYWYYDSLYDYKNNTKYNNISLLFSEYIKGNTESLTTTEEVTNAVDSALQ